MILFRIFKPFFKQGLDSKSLWQVVALSCYHCFLFGYYCCFVLFYLSLYDPPSLFWDFIIMKNYSRETVFP